MQINIEYPAMNKDDCTGCRKTQYCNSPCMYLDIIHNLAGKPKALRELLKPPEGEAEHDYKQTLVDHQEARQIVLTTTIKEIREVPDVNLRAISAMLYAKMTIGEIAFIMDKSERTIKRLCGKP